MLWARTCKLDVVLRTPTTCARDARAAICGRRTPATSLLAASVSMATASPHTSIIHAMTVRLKLSGKSPLDLRIPAFKHKIMPESNPLKFRNSVSEIGHNALTAGGGGPGASAGRGDAAAGQRGLDGSCNSKHETTRQ